MSKAIPRSPTGATPAASAPAPLATHAQLLGLVVIWAVNFSMVKVALLELEPRAFNALRFILGSGVVYAMLRAQGGVPRPHRSEWSRVLALGLIGNLVYQLFFIEGLDRTRAGNASLLLAASPVLIALLSAAVGHERVGGRVWAGLFGAVAGLALVILAGHSDVGLARETLTGDLLMLGAAVSWAVYTVGARDLIARHGPVAVTAWTLWVGTVALVLAGAPDLARTDWTALSLGTWGATLYGGVLAIGVAYLIWYEGVRRLGNTRTSVYTNLVPVVALLVAWLWLGEVPTGGQLAGAAIIIGSVRLSSSRRRSRNSFRDTG